MYGSTPRGMMKEAKKAFVVSMVDWISKDILRVIEEGKVPENWGGGGSYACTLPRSLWRGVTLPALWTGARCVSTSMM